MIGEGGAYYPDQGIFIPKFLERDEAIRRKPWSEAPWDGVAEIRPFGAMEKKIVEGSNGIENHLTCHVFAWDNHTKA